jgi:hypothetical protein
MRASLRSIRFGVFGIALLAGASMFMPAAAAAKTTIAPTTTCSNGVANSGGLGLICRVTIVNTITSTGGSSKTSVQECHGAAGHPTAACTTKTWLMNRLVTRVNQCNDSINGGGGTLRCSVHVTNNYVGSKPKTPAATVNQCVGSGGGITKNCDPFPATTTGAAITQCNGSANGGTLVGLRCSATGTRAVGGVRINQCNGSANGGGALVICSASIVNRVVSSATTSSGGTTSPSAPATSTIGSVPAGTSGPSPLMLAGLGLVFAISLGFAIRRTGRRPTAR